MSEESDSDGSSRLGGVPDLFYDIICNFVPGGVAIALYLPRLAESTYKAIDASHSAINASLSYFLVLVIAWAIGITLNVATYAVAHLTKKVFEKRKTGETFRAKIFKAPISDDSWILKVNSAHERRILTKVQAQVGFFRVLFFVSIIALIFHPSNFYVSILPDGSRLTKLCNVYYGPFCQRWPGLIVSFILWVCWHSLDKTLKRQHEKLQHK